jgi:hypothetical protein
MVVGWLGYVASLWTDPQDVDNTLAPEGKEYLLELLVYVLTGLVGGVILRLASHGFDGAPLRGQHDVRVLVYATMAPALLVVSFTLAAVIFVGIGSKLMHELDREWLSRFGAWALMTVVAWVGVSGSCCWFPF